MSLEAHLPTGFIYDAKMTQNFDLLFLVSSLHSHRFRAPIEAEVGRNYPNIPTSAEFD